MSHRKAHLFYPENDLALARGIARYTAPPAAVRLRRAGLTLPLFYGEAGDACIAQGVNAAWLRRIRDAFDTGVELFSGDCGEYAAAPWGWSKASRQYFLDLGFPKDSLPGDNALDAIRELSHRRTAAKVARELAAYLPFEAAPAATELYTVPDIYAFIADHPGGTVLKLPWSSSGRGLVATDAETARQQEDMFAGMLRRQGSVMAEPRYSKLLDFALLYEMKGGRCSYAGMSVFNNVQFGTYAGNELASENELWGRIAAMCGDDRLKAIRDGLEKALENVAGPNYEGPLGVDMMIVDNGGTPLVPLCEINFRMTMGHLCRRFYSRFAAGGSHGRFSVVPASQGSPSGFFEADVRCGRMSGGRLDLAQPGCMFSFIITLE